MIQVMRAEYRGGYRIWVEFTDGASGVADLEDFLWGPAFGPLRDIEEFKRFKITEAYRTIAWENGADISPEALYERAVRQAA
ncbi:hypothetical protein ANAEL_04865 [Anaerolineales bacterium]|nr:hypothetical protein ANAEL_04865 [Anaerolineales bacterium]